jgi:hypothetical protein
MIQGKNMSENKVLIGNSFPFSLIRRKAVITPCSLSELQGQLINAEIASFWGHSNTLNAINQILGRDLTPASDRPALTLSLANKPVLDGVEFSECWILSPDYRKNFRPAIGEEVSADAICNWQCLKITF